MNINEILRLSEKKLFKLLKTGNARREAEEIVMAALGMTKEKLYISFHAAVSAGELKKINFFISRRLKREPIQYIIGCEYFRGMKFKVRKGVLIPRQDTETLVEAAHFVSKKLPAGFTAADCGCGSGNIAAAVAAEIPGLRRIYCYDTSKTAISVTLYNLRCHGLDKKAKIISSDFFSSAENRPRFSMILSNPPYIKEGCMRGLQPEVRKEPINALAAGKDGMKYYRKFAVTGKSFMKKGGFLILESGDNMAQAVKELFLNNKWQFVKSFYDTGGNERALVFFNRR